jgi:hypothetical protein
MSATPTIATIRTAIVTAVKAAMNPGTPGNVTTVHDYRRFWRDEQKFNSLFRRVAPDLLPGKLNGWMVYAGTTREEESREWGRFYQIHKFQLEGFAGLQDAGGLTEKEFRDQVEVVRDNLRLNLAVFGNTERTSPVVQVDFFGPEKVQYGDATVWLAILTLEAEGIENKFA